MNDITAIKLNETWLHLDCSRSIAHELFDYFAFYAENYKFMPMFKKRLWDGKIRLFNTNMTLYVGLLKHLAIFCKDRKYTLSFDPEMFSRESNEKVLNYIRSLEYHNDKKERIYPRDYQEKAAIECLDRGRRTIVSSTSSGKSLMIYMVTHYLLHQKNLDKILIIVPTTTLVRQMYGDFVDYSLTDDWNVKNDTHQIMSGVDKDNNDVRVYISTWQSLYTLPRNYFHKFQCVMFDECHEASASAVKKILEKCTNAPYRFGFTGSLQKAKANKLVIQGLLGPAIKVMTNKESMNRGEAAEIKIHMKMFKWSRNEVDGVFGEPYQEEMTWLRNSDRRNRLIAKDVLVRPINQNSLVLVNNLDQAQALYDILYNKDKRRVYMVTGATDVETRNELRSIIDNNPSDRPGIITIATFGVFQRGISIRNIHNLFFGCPSKSLIRVLQSIGRGLRVSETKKRLHLWDYLDDMSCGRKRKNYSFLHGKERLKIYQEEQFPVTPLIEEV